MEPDIIAAIRGFLFILGAFLAVKRLHQQPWGAPLDRLDLAVPRWSGLAFVSVFLILILLLVLEVLYSTPKLSSSMVVFLLLALLLIKLVPLMNLRTPLVCTMMAIGIHELRPFLVSLISGPHPATVNIVMWIPEMVCFLVALFCLPQHIFMRLAKIVH